MNNLTLPPQATDLDSGVILSGGGEEQSYDIDAQANEIFLSVCAAEIYEGDLIDESAACQELDEVESRSSVGDRLADSIEIDFFSARIVLDVFVGKVRSDRDDFALDTNLIQTTHSGSLTHTQSGRTQAPVDLGTVRHATDSNVSYIAEPDVPTPNAAAVAASTRVKAVTITDSASSVVDGLEMLYRVYVDGKLNSIRLTDDSVPTLRIIKSQIPKYIGIISRIRNSTIRIDCVQQPIDDSLDSEFESGDSMLLGMYVGKRGLGPFVRLPGGTMELSLTVDQLVEHAAALARLAGNCSLLISKTRSPRTRAGAYTRHPSIGRSSWIRPAVSPTAGLRERRGSKGRSHARLRRTAAIAMIVMLSLGVSHHRVPFPDSQLLEGHTSQTPVTVIGMITNTGPSFKKAANAAELERDIPRGSPSMSESVSRAAYSPTAITSARRTSRPSPGYVNTRASSLSSILIDADGQSMLDGIDADEPHEPAGLAKLMTLTLVFEALESKKVTLSDEISIPRPAVSMDGTSLNIQPTITLTLEQAIKKVADGPANDVAEALGKAIDKAIDKDRVGFGQIMTRRARELGMNHTTFVNASGLWAPEQTTTARDMGLLVRHLAVNLPQYYKYLSHEEPAPAGSAIGEEYGFTKRYPWIEGMKGGWISSSGYNMVASTIQNRKRLIGVILGASSQDECNERMIGLLKRGLPKPRNPNNTARTSLINSTSRFARLAYDISPPR